KPIVEASIATTTLPSAIDVRLSWNGGSFSSWVPFSTTGHSAGDTYLLAAQVSSAVSQSGVYPWTMQVREVPGMGGSTVDETISGIAQVVVNDSSPLGAGWGISGVDKLVATSGGFLWITGTGDSRFFAGSGGTYTSPPEDFGTLTVNGSGYKYTAK